MDTKRSSKKQVSYSFKAVLFICFIFTVIPTYFFSKALYNKRHFQNEDWLKIVGGMNKTDVDNVLGKPTVGTVVGENSFSYSYWDARINSDVLFREGLEICYFNVDGKLLVGQAYAFKKNTITKKFSIKSIKKWNPDN